MTHTHWTKEICKQKALEYQNRRDFNAANGNIYAFALRHGFLDEICSHMIPLGNKYKRCIYAYEFPDKSVYVGLTFDFNRRKTDREKRLNDTVTQYVNKTGLIPIHKQLTDYIKVEEAVLLEAEFVKAYKDNNWHIINKAKTGSVGANILYWTKERCLIEGLKYDKRSDFSHYSKGAYDSAKKHGWLQEIYSHMKPVSNLYWTKERCEIKALLCDTRKEFRKDYMGAYNSARKHNWLDEICSHMIIPTKKVWMIEECKQEALKYVTRYDFRTKSNKIYNIARKNNWLDKICSHMIKRIRSGKRKWTDEKCLESALKYESFVEWMTKDKGAYIAAHKYGLFEKCVKHMKRYK